MKRERAEVLMVNLIVVGLAVVSFMAMSSIQTLSPLNNMVIYDRTPLFEWSSWSDEYELLIDEDSEFRSPLSFEVTGRSIAIENELDFGTYWWKVKSGDAESAPRKFTIVSTVELARPEKSVLINTGNTELLLHRSGVTGAVTLAVDESLKIGEEENVKAEQK